jgi:hypothetical protein
MLAASAMARRMLVDISPVTVLCCSIAAAVKAAGRGDTFRGIRTPWRAT